MSTLFTQRVVYKRTALFIIAPNWKQCECPALANACIMVAHPTMGYPYTMPEHRGGADSSPLLRDTGLLCGRLTGGCPFDLAKASLGLHCAVWVFFYPPLLLSHFIRLYQSCIGLQVLHTLVLFPLSFALFPLDVFNKQLSLGIYFLEDAN